LNGFTAEDHRLHSARGLVLFASIFGPACASVLGQSASTQSGALGVFDNQSDIGKVQPAGNVNFDAAGGAYTVASAGWDLWADNDAFHFVWKKVSGDLSLTADIQLAPPSAGSHPNRKAFVMFRQSLDPDSMYADAAVHNSGETALQYRHDKGNTTQDIFFDLGAPRTVRLEKRGDTITLFVSMKGEPLHQSGASIKLHFAEPFYAGLGVCSHRDGALESATFSHVELKPLTAPLSPAPMALNSSLQTIDTRNNYRRAHVVETGKYKIEAPNWSRDGKTLIFTRDGRLC
jgi:TolB protein